MSVTTSDPPALPAGFSLRPLTLDDASAVVRLIRDDELDALGETYLDLADLLGDWGRPSFCSGTDAVGVVDGHGRLVAFGELSRPERAEGVVAAAVRGRGIGSVLLPWIERRAAAAGSEIVGHTVPVAHRTPSSCSPAGVNSPGGPSGVLQLPPDAEIPAATLRQSGGSGSSDPAVSSRPRIGRSRTRSPNGPTVPR